MDAYEASKQELTAENAALKDSLRTLQVRTDLSRPWVAPLTTRHPRIGLLACECATNLAPHCLRAWLQEEMQGLVRTHAAAASTPDAAAPSDTPLKGRLVRGSPHAAANEPSFWAHVAAALPIMLRAHGAEWGACVCRTCLTCRTRWRATASSTACAPRWPPFRSATSRGSPPLSGSGCSQGRLPWQPCLMPGPCAPAGCVCDCGAAWLQERMAALAAGAAEDDASEREVELDAQLAAARAIIAEQETIISAALHAGHSPE